MKRAELIRALKSMGCVAPETGMISTTQHHRLALKVPAPLACYRLGRSELELGPMSAKEE